jgi:hypothetical protein
VNEYPDIIAAGSDIELSDSSQASVWRKEDERILPHHQKYSLDLISSCRLYSLLETSTMLRRANCKQYSHVEMVVAMMRAGPMGVIIESDF